MKTIVNITKLTFFMILILHIITCYWNFVINYWGYADERNCLRCSVIGPSLFNKCEEDYLTLEDGTTCNPFYGEAYQWYSPTDWLDYSSSNLFKKDIGAVKKYLFLFYHSVLFLGLNEIGPVNEYEMFNSVMILIVCSIINATLNSEISLLVSTLHIKKS